MTTNKSEQDILQINQADETQIEEIDNSDDMFLDLADIFAKKALLDIENSNSTKEEKIKQLQELLSTTFGTNLLIEKQLGKNNIFSSISNGLNYFSSIFDNDQQSQNDLFESLKNKLYDYFSTYYKSIQSKISFDNLKASAIDNALFEKLIGMQLLDTNTTTALFNIRKKILQGELSNYVIELKKNWSIDNNAEDEYLNIGESDKISEEDESNTDITDNTDTTATINTATEGKKTPQHIINMANDYIGTQYSRGGMSPKKGFDCSGLVFFIFRKLGITLPGRTSRDMFLGYKTIGPIIKKGSTLTPNIKDIKKGNLLFWHSTDKKPSWKTQGPIPGITKDNKKYFIHHVAIVESINESTGEITILQASGKEVNRKTINPTTILNNKGDLNSELYFADIDYAKT